MNSTRRVLVIGGGVIGLSSALALRRAGFAVQIWTRDLPETTTSRVAGAFFYPMRVHIDERTRVWLRDTWLHFHHLASTVPQAGVWIRDAFEFLKPSSPVPTWFDAIGGAQPVATIDLPPTYSGGLRFACPVVEPLHYLEWLLQENRRSGVDYRVRTLHSLHESAGHADLVVVATGLFTRDLVADPELQPVRGQVVVVDRPLGSKVLIDETNPQAVTYVIPHRDTSVLGGVAQPGDEDLRIRGDESAAILERANLWHPQFQDAKVLHARTGLRPFRNMVRVELSPAQTDRPALVFNYGHGGAGFTLSWGCALEVVRLATNYFRERAACE